MAQKENRTKLLSFSFLVNHFAASTLSSNNINNLQVQTLDFQNNRLPPRLGFFCFGSSLGVTDNYNG